MSNLDYIGKELDIFAHAVGWKRYFGTKLAPYIGQRVLEVGAGIGTTSAVLCNPGSVDWLCLEPDSGLKQILDEKIRTGALPSQCRSQHGIIADLEEVDLFDTILYIDVLEHIADDHQEIQRAASHLNPNGTVIVLSPAHQWLFSPFDKEIGHFRRYSKASLSAIKPVGCALEKLIYLDSMGMLLSLGNRLILNQSMPTVQQIEYWDRRIVPISRILDPLLNFSMGKSIVAVWRKL